MARLIAFDVDSTLLRVESLDTAIEAVLAGLSGEDARASRERLHAITEAGMTGRMALEDSLRSRLEIAALDRARVEDMAENLRRQITPGMKPLLQQLRRQGDRLHAISGGFVDLILPALSDLGFTGAEVHANRFLWTDDQVGGLDETCPLCRNGGKAEILRVIAGDSTDVVMVGDGMTDFEAFEDGAADRFIGFGLIAAREVVIAAAEWSGGEYVRTVDALATALRRPA